ncbi:MAG: hypothetical protein C4294_19870, partial [Nitrospiraceae bacterium]
MIEEDTVFIDHFQSDVGEFTTSFSSAGCERRHPTGLQTFRSRERAHRAIAEQTTGFAAWDNLPKASAQQQAFDESRWRRDALTNTRAEIGERIPFDRGKHPS